MILDLILEQMQQDARRIVSITDDGSGVPLVTTAYPFAVNSELTIVGNSNPTYNGVFGDVSQVTPTTFTLSSTSFDFNGFGGEIIAAS